MNALFELHLDRVFAFARTLLNNRSDVEEVTSEAFVRAFERASTFRGECPFRGWLFGITRNLCLDRLRQPRLILLEPDAAEWSASDEGKSASQMETSIFVRKAVAELSPEYRTALILCDVEQWDAREVAEMLGKSLPATKSILYRARRALRDQLTSLSEEEERA